MKLQRCTHHTWTTPLLCSVIRCYFKYLKNPKIVVCHEVAMLHTSHLNNLIHIAMLSSKKLPQYLPKEPKNSYLHWSCTHYTWITELLCSVLRCFLKNQKKQKSVIFNEVVKLHTPHFNSSIAMPRNKVLSQVQKEPKNCNLPWSYEVANITLEQLNCYAQ